VVCIGQRGLSRFFLKAVTLATAAAAGRHLVARPIARMVLMRWS
jgi:hypothetical protein